MSVTHEKKREGRFMVGVLILTPATLLSKLIGLFYKVPLLRIVGVEGMAYFLSAYHVYSLLFVLAAAGLPTALSILVARLIAKGEGERISFLFGVATALFFALGVIGSLLIWLCSDRIAAALSMSRTQAAELIASGKVQKNYREAAKGDAAVAEGDVISARGFGKFELAEVGRLTKKGRTAILIRRYI